MSLDLFLAPYSPFGSWRDEWSGVPLELRSFLADELPPREFVASVRAVVFRGDEVLLVHGNPPILSVGGRGEPGETIEETLLREVAEESGWRVTPIALIGLIHYRHLDDQRPAWGRPAPEFIDPIFAVEAIAPAPDLLLPGENPCEFVSILEIERYGIEEINRTFLTAALKRRSEAASIL